MSGEVAILNVGVGDTKLSFNPKNPAEVARASRVVKDMIRRGFVLLIEVGHNEKGPIYQRATDFDEATAEYIVAGSPGDIEEEPSHEQKQASSPRKGRKAAPRRRIPAATTNSVAVARTAGG